MTKRAQYIMEIAAKFLIPDSKPGDRWSGKLKIVKVKNAQAKG